MKQPKLRIVEGLSNIEEWKVISISWYETGEIQSIIARVNGTFDFQDILFTNYSPNKIELRAGLLVGELEDNV